MTSTRALRPGLIDRLHDDDGEEPRWTIDVAKERVARDLEQLLNAKRGPQAATPLPPLAACSVLGFGLADMSALSIRSDADRRRICEGIHQAIEDHEPRLTDLRVHCRGADGRADQVGFTITARLRLHPLDEPASFDAVLQTGLLAYTVRRT